MKILFDGYVQIDRRPCRVSRVERWNNDRLPRLGEKIELSSAGSLGTIIEVTWTHTRTSVYMKLGIDHLTLERARVMEQEGWEFEFNGDDIQLPKQLSEDEIGVVLRRPTGITQRNRG